MVTRLKLWWYGYRIRHLEALYDEAQDAEQYAHKLKHECRRKIQALKVRAMNEVAG